MVNAFALSVQVSASSSSDVDEVNQLQKSIDSGEPCDLIPLVAADHIQLSIVSATGVRDDGGASSPPLAAVFTPSTLIESTFEQLQLATMQAEASLSLSSPHTIHWLEKEPREISHALLSLIHPFLAENFTIKAILSSCTHHRQHATSKHYHAPSDLVLLDLSHTPRSVIADLLDNISSNCPTIHSGPESTILKVVLLSCVQFHATKNSEAAAPPEYHDSLHHPSPTTTSNSSKSGTAVVDIPTCPVCLHRVDPFRLGLPHNRAQHLLCSKFCPPPNLAAGNQHSAVSCPRQRLLRPWPPPSSCVACRVIDRYWQKDTDEHDAIGEHDADDGSLVCIVCGMKETLWVCLTCGFVGCGRYSSKHAVEHNSVTGHPFCLELSTLRIWSYVDGEFAHRVDLLECPSSPPLLQPWVASGRGKRRASAGAVAATYTAGEDSSGYYHNNTAASSASNNNTPYDMSLDDYERMIAANFASVDEKSPKKATMIGEEYEALLQSALEEQAQHYEGEITRLRAKLAAEQVDHASMTAAEAKEIENLKKAIDLLRENIDGAGRDLLGLQAQEAGHRATSQRLLREQRVTQDLLAKIREEASYEHEEGRMQIEELEQQIADLTANQKMMQQFSENEDLKNSQIFGAEQSPNPKGKKGKKLRKFFRR